jgi:polyhydroxybutyrate depolymerase
MRTETLAVSVLAAALALALARPTAGEESGTRGFRVRVGQLERVYFLHVPPRASNGKPLPLVLMFHGGGGTPAWAERETAFSELADREGFLVAYPEGIGRSWNDGRDSGLIPAQREHIDDLAFVEAMLDQIAQSHPVDPRRVFATGISNGGFFSEFLGAHLAQRIAAIAPVAGGIPARWAGTFVPAAPVSVLVIQSTSDPLVPYGGGDVRLPHGASRGEVLPTVETVRKWVEHDGCARHPVERELPDSDPADGCRVRSFTYAAGHYGTEVVLYRLDGAGHTWAGGRQYLPQSAVGAVCRDIRATEVIWEFFRTHPRPSR